MVTPLRAIAVTIDEPSTPCVASMIAFDATIEEFRKNCDVAAMKSSASRACAVEVAAGGAPIAMWKSAVGGGIAAVHLVAP